MEPWRLKRWRLPSSPSGGIFYTCARPGRSKGSKGKVADRLVNEWVQKLPGQSVRLLSLLGQKPDGTSEWAFYSFYHKGQSFQAWLDQNHSEKTIKVLEYPTCDMRPIPHNVLAPIALELMKLVSEGKQVVLMDSGGIQRTGQVCRHIGAIEVGSS